MSYKQPLIPNLTLKGIDLKIQDIQVKMDASLSWVAKCFGLADRIVEWRDEKEYIYPATFEANTKDPISMMPGDAWNSFAFWVKTGQATIVNNTDFPPKYPMMKYEVSCIFFVDIRRIDNVLTYKETKSKLTEDIFHFFTNLNFAGKLVPTRFIDDDITKIYDGFTIEQVDNRFKMYPKWACRMDFDLFYRDGCYSTNTYSIT